MSTPTQVTVTQAYRFALDPTSVQVANLYRHAGAARVAFNWGLARVKANLGQRESERSYGTSEASLTPSLSWSLYSMRRAWNAEKRQIAPWWAECSKEAYNTGLGQLASALKNWSDSRSGKRKGPPMGFPRFKSRRAAPPSIRFTTGAIRLGDDRRHVVLPVLGAIRTHEGTGKLHRRIAAGTARILSASVTLSRGRWFATFTVEVKRLARTPSRPDAAVGVDLGIKSLAVMSDGAVINNPRNYEKARRKLARTSRTVSRRQGPDHRTGQEPSNRWRRANSARNKVHYKVANTRADGLHKLTTALVREYGVIVVEDLNVAGMLQNRKLARHVADAGFAELRRQLEYKTAWNDGRLEVASRWFPSSKTCSVCKTVKPKLSLAQRVFTCENCGMVRDRDHNAAINLAGLVHAHVAGSGPETKNGRGADRKTRLALADGREASTPRLASATPGPDGDFRPAMNESLGMRNPREREPS